MPIARSRSGMRLTGVAVTTSRPKKASSRSSGTASAGPAAASIGVDTAQPRMPPAALIREAPLPITGAPQPMWTRPRTPTSSVVSPIMIRPLASGRSGWRQIRIAIPASRNGTSTSSRPNSPDTTAVAASFSQPFSLNQVPAAVASASANSSRPTPSLRWAGSRFLAPWPKPRKIAAIGLASALSALIRTERDGGAGGAGLAAAFFAGAAFRAAAFFAGGLPGAFAAAFLAGPGLVLRAAFPGVRVAMGQQPTGADHRCTCARAGPPGRVADTPSP